MSLHHRPDPEDNRTRSEEWSVLGLASDPVPGDSATIRWVAYEFRQRSDNADRIRGEVQGMLTDQSLMTWVGDSAEAFWRACEPFPGQLAAVHQAYGDVSDALEAYASALDSAQWDAGIAYSRGVDAWQSVGVAPGDTGSLSGSGTDGDFRARIDGMLQGRPAADGNPHVQDQLVGARRGAEQAREAWSRAGRTCQGAIEKAADAMWNAVASSGAASGGFDERFARFGGKSSDLILVRHDDPSVTSAADGTRDAAELAKALANPDDPWSKAEIELVGQDLRDHQDDAAFLQAFYAGGGAASTALLLRRLAPPEGRQLLPQDRDKLAGKDTIANYAAGVAAASMYSDLGLVHLPPNVWDPLFKGTDYQMPAALLFAYGPPGSQWGHTLLANAGARVLQFDGSRQGLDTATWGLAPDILARVGENPDACRDLLDPAKSSQAAVDMNYQSLLHQAWWYPHMQTDGVAALIIHNATTDVAGHPDASLAATSALFHNLDGGQLTPHLAMAVSQASAAHLDSMMQDSTSKMVDGSTIAPGIIPLSPQEMDNVLKSFAGDHNAVQNLSGAIGARTLDLSRNGQFVSDVPGGTTADAKLLEQLGSLQGQLDVHQQQAGVDLAHQQDHVNAETQAWIRTLTGEANAVGPTPAKILHNANPALTPFYEDFFPTDNAAKAATQASFSLSAGASALDVPVVQGMIANGRIVPPAGATWFHDGMVDLSTPDARNQFNYWYDHDGSQGAQLARTMSGHVTTGYNDAGRAWNVK